jgi:hypothetical protein
MFLGIAVQRKLHRGVGGGGAPTNPYPLYPTLDLNAVPYCAGDGPYWTQRIVVAPEPPVTTRQVSVSTWAAFDTECRVPGTEITVTGSFSSAGDNINGSMTDVDVVLNPGVIISGGLVLGGFGAGHLLTRVRFRGPTLGAYSGGQIHNVSLFAGCRGVRFSGIGVTGGSVSAGDKKVALEFSTGATHERFLLDHCRGHSGNSFQLGECHDFVAAGNSIYSGADTTQVTPNDEAWCFRVANGSPGVILFDNDLRNPRFHNIRLHTPTGSSTRGLGWVSGNLILDHTEARIFNNARASAGNTGRYSASWFENNDVHAEDESATFTPNLNVDYCDYTRIRNNRFYGDFVLGNITVTNTTDSLIEGNTFNASVPAPAWTRAGDPTGLDWTP